MKRHDRHTIALWVLAFIVPLIAAADSWLWADITTTVHECATGADGRSSSIAVFLLLVLAAPVAIGWRVRRARRPLADALVPVFISAVLGFVFVYLGFELWWTGHDCMT